MAAEHLGFQRRCASPGLGCISHHPSSGLEGFHLLLRAVIYLNSLRLLRCVLFVSQIPTRLTATAPAPAPKRLRSSTLGLNWAATTGEREEGLKRRAAVGTRKSIRYVVCVRS